MKYIDVDKLQETICRAVTNPAIKGRFNALINEQPLADVKEVKHGKWIEKEEDLGYDVYQCSVCKEEYCLETGSPQENNYDYCPNCGARMDGGVKE